MPRFILNPFEGSFDAVTRPSQNLWVRVTDSVTATNNKVIDTVSLTSFTSIKYIISARNKTNNVAKYLELSVNYNQSSLKDTVSAKINGGLSMNVDANSNAGNLELDITNNESFDIDLEVAKLVLA